MGNEIVYKMHFKNWCNDTGRYYGNTHNSSDNIDLVTCKTCLKKYKRLSKKSHN